MVRIFLVFSAVSGGLSVGAGAFASHSLRDRIPERSLEIFDTAARYQMTHALALGLVALLLLTPPFNRSASLQIAGYGFILGTLIFCGSLYGLSLTQIPILGAITPVGGVAFLIGWIGLGIAAWTKASLPCPPPSP